MKQTEMLQAESIFRSVMDGPAMDGSRFDMDEFFDEENPFADDGTETIWQCDLINRLGKSIDV